MFKVNIYNKEGTLDFSLETLYLEDARERRNYYIKELNKQGIFDKTLYPTIFKFRKSNINNNYDYYYLEG